MSLGTAITIVREAVMETLIISVPLLLIGMVVGLVVAILQATTSIQEQTLSFVPKIVAILVGLVIFGRFLLESLVEYTRRLFESIPTI
jgi:flagellar biosynthetic protein FliQ